MLWQAPIRLPQLLQKFPSGLNVVHGNLHLFQTGLNLRSVFNMFRSVPPQVPGRVARARYAGRMYSRSFRLLSKCGMAKTGQKRTVRVRPSSVGSRTAPKGLSEFWLTCTGPGTFVRTHSYRLLRTRRTSTITGSES